MIQAKATKRRWFSALSFVDVSSAAMACRQISQAFYDDICDPTLCTVLLISFRFGCEAISKSRKSVEVRSWDCRWHGSWAAETTPYVVGIDRPSHDTDHWPRDATALNKLLLHYYTIQEDCTHLLRMNFWHSKYNGIK